MRFLLHASGAAAACLALGGCGGSDAKTILDTEKVERSIEASIKEQRNLDSDVSCPANVEQKKGNTFTCVATVKGKQFEFRVSQTDSEGHVTYLGI